MKPLLELEGLTLSFGGLNAVADLDLVLREGEILGLIGPNGAGKTTVLNLINRFYEPDRGRIVFEGRDITQIRPHEVITLGIARTFQNVELFRHLTVMDNLLVGMHSQIRYGVFQGVLYTPRVRSEEQNLKARARDLLSFLGLDSYASVNVSILPYGIQKLVELARALVSRPKLLLLDEPVAGMNEKESEELMHKLLLVRNELKATILLIEHDLKFVMNLCDRVAVLNFGRKIAEGTPEEVRMNPLVIQAYTGEEECSC